MIGWARGGRRLWRCRWPEAGALPALAVLAALGAACGAGPRLPAETAARAVEARRWDRALKALDRVVEASPDSLEARRDRVRAAQAAGLLPERLEALRTQAAGEEPRVALLYELALAVAATGEPRSDREAVTLLVRVAAGRPEEADVPYRIGLIRLEQELFCEAVGSLRRASTTDPTGVRPRLALALALVGCDREDEARVVLGEVADLRPSAEEVRRGRAILARMGNPMARVPEALRSTYRDALTALAEESSPGEAILLVEEALAVAPDCAPLLTLLGLANVRLGQLARARVAFERAVELWPGDATPLLELSSIAEETGDNAAAVRHLEAAVAVEPLGAEAWGELGRIHYRRRDYLEAARAFRRLSVVDGGALMSRLWLARALVRAGRDDQAEQVYLELLETRPRTFEACVQLGTIYRQRRLQAGSGARAEELASRARHYYRLALEVRPQDPMVQRLLAALEAGE